MRRAILIVAALLIVTGLTFSVYLAFNNRKVAFELDDFFSEGRTIDSNGAFEGKFKSDRVGFEICDYNYWVEDKTLYITLYASTNSKKALPKSEDGYVTLRLETGTEIEHIRYVYDEKQTALSFNYK